jgi:hypothetical protein
MVLLKHVEQCIDSIRGGKKGSVGKGSVGNGTRDLVGDSMKELNKIEGEGSTVHLKEVRGPVCSGTIAELVALPCKVIVALPDKSPIRRSIVISTGGGSPWCTETGNIRVLR